MPKYIQDRLRDQISMKTAFRWLSLLLLLSHALCSVTNTTEFWRTQLGIPAGEMHFQCYSGFEQINWYRPAGQSQMFYQLFSEAGSDISNPDPKVPLIIWLQGGPGGSSQFGAFTENGPIRIVNGKPQLFAYSWNLLGHTLFIDQPLNVGFSHYGDRNSTSQVSSANEAGEHLLNFMDNFYKDWPQLKQSPLYITGESFAGHYIPAFARTIIMNQTWQDATGVKLAGVAIGDGWVDPPNQFNYFDSLLYSAGIVSNKFRDTVTWFQTQGIVNLLKGELNTATDYFDFLTNDDDVKEKYLGGMNNYNYRQYSYGDESFADFLQSNKASLGVPANINYVPGSEAIYNSFKKDIGRSYVSDVIILLRHIRVLIYNGQDDYVVNTAGVLQYLNSMNWENINGWKRAKKEQWTIAGEVRGWAKVSGNLWFVLLNGAGHLVPTDQPDSAFNMLGHYLRNDKDWKG